VTLAIIQLFAFQIVLPAIFVISLWKTNVANRIDWIVQLLFKTYFHRMDNPHRSMGLVWDILPVCMANLSNSCYLPILEKDKITAFSDKVDWEREIFKRD
jgi:hypothetical protein